MSEKLLSSGMNNLNVLVLIENKVDLYPVHSLLVRNLAVGGLSDYWCVLFQVLPNNTCLNSTSC